MDYITYLLTYLLKICVWFNLCYDYGSNVIAFNISKHISWTGIFSASRCHPLPHVHFVECSKCAKQPQQMPGLKLGSTRAVDFTIGHYPDHSDQNQFKKMVISQICPTDAGTSTSNGYSSNHWAIEVVASDIVNDLERNLILLSSSQERFLDPQTLVIKSRRGRWYLIVITSAPIATSKFL